MPKFKSPTREDQFDFLIRCYFGPGEDALAVCVRRAYLDLNRTLHGFAQLREAAGVREGGHALVRKQLKVLQGLDSANQAGFDAWHRTSRHQLRRFYRSNGFNSFTIGQAQKWLNMSLKYVFALGERRLPRFDRFYRFAHVPIDNVLLSRLTTFEIQGPRSPWSRVDRYDTYFRLQRAVRSRFRGDAPLAVEFRLWLKTSAISGAGN